VLLINTQFLGVLPVVSSYAHVANLNITESNLVQNVFLELLEGIPKGDCGLKTRHIRRIILVVLRNQRSPQVLAATRKSLLELGEQFTVPVLERLDRIQEALDVHDVSIFEVVDSCINNDFFFESLPGIILFLKPVRGGLMFVIPRTLTSKERITIKSVHSYLFPCLYDMGGWFL
jgi:hypothetical protein